MSRDISRIGNLIFVSPTYREFETNNNFLVIKSPGSMMVLTLKVTSAAFNYQDGVIEDETSLLNSQKKYRLKALPSFLAYLGYCFNCGTHLVGPVFELRDYMDWTNNHGLWSPTASPPPPSPYTATFLATLKALFCMGLYMFLTGAYPLSFVTNPEFMKWGYWHRVWYQFLCGFGARWKYYFIWSLSEAAVIVSGFGFSGWSGGGEERKPKPLWSRAQNVDIVNVELATSAAEIPKYWNIHVSVWLRHYVYDRLSVKGERPGFKQLLGTQVVSAVWHVSKIISWFWILRLSSSVHSVDKTLAPEIVILICTNF